MPGHIRVGGPMRLEVLLRGESLALEGQVVWTAEPPPSRQAVRPSFGVRFGHLAVECPRLEQLLALKGLPPPPWRGRLAFGREDVGAAWLFP